MHHTIESRYKFAHVWSSVCRELEQFCLAILHATCNCVSTLLAYISWV